MFCRRDAAARTGYVTPGQAASHAQTSGSVGGTLLGAAAGAAIGSASGHAGAGALIGAGAGLIAGTAVGADNARHAASDVEQDYAAAYYACMDADGRRAAAGRRRTLMAMVPRRPIITAPTLIRIPITRPIIMGPAISLWLRLRRRLLWRRLHGGRGFGGHRR